MDSRLGLTQEMRLETLCDDRELWSPLLYSGLKDCDLLRLQCETFTRVSLGVTGGRAGSSGCKRREGGQEKRLLLILSTISSSAIFSSSPSILILSVVLSLSHTCLMLTTCRSYVYAYQTHIPGCRR